MNAEDIYVKGEDGINEFFAGIRILTEYCEFDYPNEENCIIGSAESHYSKAVNLIQFEGM